MDDNLNVPSFGNSDNLSEVSEKMKKGSLSGKSSTITGKMKVTLKSLLQKKNCIAGAICFSIGSLTAPAIEQVLKNLTVSDAGKMFAQDAITPNAFKTSNGSLGYNNGNIADYIMNMDDPKAGVYFIQDNMSGQVDYILSHTPYQSLDNFISESGYDSVEDFMKNYSDVIYSELKLDQAIEKSTHGGK